MKTFTEYLTEAKKTYSVLVKVAGELPEGFADELKGRLSPRVIANFEQLKTTPVTETPLDFPELCNVEVHTFNIVTEYPITTSEVEKEIFEMGCCEPGYYKVRNSLSPSEEYQATDDKKEGALLHDNEYKEALKIKHKEYFGDDFNNSFLKDLAKTAKERKKELGHDKLKADIYQDVPKLKQDKAGAKSPVGSN